MTAKETIRAKLFKLRLRARQTGQVRLPASAVALWTEAGIHFLLSAVLSGAVLLGDCAPFGVAFVGAAGSGLWGMAALAGACLGSVCLLELTQGLRCASAATLTFAAAFAFYDWKPLRQPWAMPLIAGAINAATGVIVRSQAGWTPSGMIAFALETALTVGACRCYALALAPLRPGRQDRLPSPAGRAGLLVLTATVLLALAPLHLIQDVSVGRCLAALTVLAAASQAGSAPGTILGAVLGAAMDLGANATPVYTMAYALGGLAAGAVRGKGRPAAALAFAGTNAAALLWTWGRGLPLSGLYEGALAALIFSPCLRGAWGCWGPGWPRSCPAREIWGESAWSSDSWSRPPPPSGPCPRPCGPPFARPGTTTTCPSSLTGPPESCAGAAPCGTGAGSRTMPPPSTP